MIIKTKNLCDNMFNTNNIIYKKSLARPSKSLVSVKLYNDIKDLKNIQSIFNQYSLIENSLNKFILTEIVNYFYRHKIEDFNILENKIDITNIIHFSITCKTLKELLQFILQIEFSDKEYLLINIENLYSYPNLEFIILICYSFKKCHIYRSNFSNDLYILYCEYKRNDELKLFLKYLLENWTLNLRLIGLNIPTDIQNDVFNLNTCIFMRKIKDNDILKDLTLEKSIKINNEKEVIYNYYCKYLKLTTYINCDCSNIQDCIFMNCKICLNCYSLFSS